LVSNEATYMSPKYRSSKAPGYVVMRDVRTGRPVRIPVGVIPKVLWPETWYETLSERCRVHD